MRPILLSFFRFIVRKMFLSPFTSLFTQLILLLSVLFQHHISITFKSLLIYFPKCQLKLSDKNKYGGFHISKFKKTHGTPTVLCGNLVQWLTINVTKKKLGNHTGKRRLKLTVTQSTDNYWALLPLLKPLLHNSQPLCYCTCKAAPEKQRPTRVRHVVF